MRYRLRTLLIVLAIGPMVLAGVFWLATFPDEDSVAKAYLRTVVGGVLVLAICGMLAEIFDSYGNEC